MMNKRMSVALEFPEVILDMISVSFSMIGLLVDKFEIGTELEFKMIFAYVRVMADVVGVEELIPK